MITLRVGMNLLWLVPGAAGGAENYATRLLRALAEEPADDVEVSILCNRRFPSAHPELAAALPTAVAPFDGRPRAARIAMESTWLAREASRRDLRLVHHVNDVIPWIRSRPSALTIHDLRSMAGGEVLGRAHAAYLRTRVPISVRRSAVIMTPTEFVRRQVLDVLHADPARVVVVSAPLFPGPETSGDAKAAPIADRYFIYPAITNRYKNHAILLESFAKLAATHPEVKLMLPGSPGDAESDVRASIRRLGLEDRVRRPGRIHHGELALLTAGAVGLVYPSRFEGYGLPLAEAMAIGCPVIASSATALPEVVGDAGVLVGPDDVSGWTDAMARLLDNAELRSRLVDSGRDRVRMLTPVAAARELIGAYRIAADDR